MQTLDEISPKDRADKEIESKLILFCVKFTHNLSVSHGSHGGKGNEGRRRVSTFLYVSTVTCVAFGFDFFAKDIPAIYFLREEIHHPNLIIFYYVERGERRQNEWS
jgi:hypothetical protein